MTERITLDAHALTPDVEASAQRVPTFRVLAYTGAPMEVGGDAPTVVDLAAFIPPSKQIPVLRQHDPNRVIGHTTSITVEAGQLVVSGVVSGSGADAEEVVASARKGYRWQASIGADVTRVSRRLGRGESATVNGRKVVGPARVVEVTLKEVSLVAMGADGETDAEISAQRGTPAESSNMDDLKFRAAVDEATLADWPADMMPKVMDLRAEAFQGPQTQEALDALEASLNGLVKRQRDREFRDSFKVVPNPTLGGGSKSSASAVDVIECATALMLDQDFTYAEYPQQTISAARRLRCRDPLDICAEWLQMNGQDPTGGAGQLANKALAIRASAGAGVSTMSLTDVFSNVAGKAALRNYFEQQSTFGPIVSVKDAKDFKTWTEVGLTGIDDLTALGAAGQIEHATLGERVFTGSVETYARMFSITRESLINDDLGLLTAVPQALAVSAARGVTNQVYDALLGGIGGDYTTGNGNALGAGASSALSIESLTAAVALMRKQTGGKSGATSQFLNIRPATLVVGPDQEMRARTIIGASEVQLTQSHDPSAATTGAPVPNRNPIADLNLTLVVDPRLNATQWFLVGDTRWKPIYLSYLNGKRGPVIETSDLDFSQLGIQIRCYMDVGASRGEAKAVVYSPGA